MPARNALLADAVPREVYGRAYGFERAMDNLGAVLGPLLALALIALVSVRTAILLSIIPGLLAVGAIIYAIRHLPRLEARERLPLRLRVRPVLRGRLGALMFAVGAFEFGNIDALAPEGKRARAQRRPRRPHFVQGGRLRKVIRDARSSREARAGSG